MKKLFIAFVLLFACLSGEAQTIENIFNAFKNKPGVEFMPVNKEMLQMATSMAAQKSDSLDTAKATELIKNVETINILSLEEAAIDVKRDFLDMVKDINLINYEQIMDVKDDDEQITIYGKTENDSIKELVIIMFEPDDPGLIQIVGDIQLEDIGKIIKMNK